MKKEIRYKYETDSGQVISGMYEFEQISSTQFSGWSLPDVTSSYISDSGVNTIWVNPEAVKLIRQKLRRRKKRKDFLDHYLYLLSTINHLSKVDRRYDNKQFVPVHYKTMVTVISRDLFPKIVKDLEEWGVIEVEESYQAGKRSKGFRLLSPYDSGMKKRKIKDKLMNEKLTRRKKNLYKELENLPDVYQYLSMTNTWISMDYESAYSYNLKNYKTCTSVYDSNFYSISAYQDGEYHFKPDKFANRAHSNLTNLKTDLRAFCHVDGETLGQTDIKNSQPLFFYLHIKDLPQISLDEKRNYKEIVESGRFYEFFMDALNIPHSKRSEVKHSILASIFYDSYRKNDRYMKVFEIQFPTIAAYIIEHKKRDHRKLAQILQKAESKFIIEKVVKRFVDLHGNDLEFISTIHDSIVVTEDKLSEAERIMRECFWEEGLNPQLTTEKFSSYIN